MYKSIEVKKSKIHNKGVFAKEKLFTGDTFECDILLLNKCNIPFELSDYIFPFNKDIKCICIGMPNFINHSIVPNIKILSIDKINLIKKFIIIKDIEIGEELTLYYSDTFNKLFNIEGY